MAIEIARPAVNVFAKFTEGAEITELPTLPTCLVAPLTEVHEEQEYSGYIANDNTVDSSIVLDLDYITSELLIDKVTNRLLNGDETRPELELLPLPKKCRDQLEEIMQASHDSYIETETYNDVVENANISLFNNFIVKGSLKVTRVDKTITGISNITGVTLDAVYPGIAEGDYNLSYVNASTEISFDGGTAVDISVDGTYTLKNSDGDDAVIITVVAASLPGTDQTDTLSVKSRNRVLEEDNDFIVDYDNHSFGLEATVTESYSAISGNIGNLIVEYNFLPLVTISCTVEYKNTLGDVVTIDLQPGEFSVDDTDGSVKISMNEDRRTRIAISDADPFITANEIKIFITYFALRTDLDDTVVTVDPNVDSENIELRFGKLSVANPFAHILEAMSVASSKTLLATPANFFTGSYTTEVDRVGELLEKHMLGFLVPATLDDNYVNNFAGHINEMNLAENHSWRNLVQTVKNPNYNDMLSDDDEGQATPDEITYDVSGGPTSLLTLDVSELALTDEQYDQIETFDLEILGPVELIERADITAGNSTLETLTFKSTYLTVLEDSGSVYNVLTMITDPTDDLSGLADGYHIVTQSGLDNFNAVNGDITTTADSIVQLSAGTWSEVLSSTLLSMGDVVEIGGNPYFYDGDWNYLSKIIYKISKKYTKAEQSTYIKNYGQDKSQIEWWVRGPDSVQATEGDELVDVAGYYRSAVSAAADSTLPPQQPTTNLAISGISGLNRSNKYFRPSQIDTILQGGIDWAVIEETGDRPVSLRALTTDLTSLKTAEQSVAKVRMYSLYTIYLNMLGVKGKNNINPDFIKNIFIPKLQACIRILETKKFKGLSRGIGPIISRGELLQVFQDPDQLDKIRSKIRIYVQYPANSIDIDLLF